MIRKGYGPTLHEHRSAFGVELDIALPGSDLPVVVAQDVYGEVEERMQLLVYPPGDGPEVEESVGIRFNPDGTIAEIRLPEGVPACTWGAPEPTDRLKERDGA